MTKRITLSPQLYIDLDSADAMAGTEAARDYWIEKCEATHNGQASPEIEAASGLAEAMLTVAISETPEVLAAQLFGAFRMLLEVSSHAELVEVSA